MKKILSVLAVMLAVVLLGACKEKPKQAPKPTEKPKKVLFQEECNRQLHEYIKDNFRNPDVTKLSDFSIVASSDSLCVMNFRFVAENAYGGHVNGKGQFILLRYENNLFVSFMSDKSENAHCIDSDWLGEATGMLAFSLPMEYADTDSFVKKKCCKKDTFDATDEYVQAYCIVKKFGRSLSDN